MSEAEPVERFRQECELLGIGDLDAVHLGAADVLERARQELAGTVEGRGDEGARLDDVVVEFLVESTEGDDPAFRQIVFDRGVETVSRGRLQVGIALADRVLAEIDRLRRRDLLESGPRDRTRKGELRLQRIGEGVFRL